MKEIADKQNWPYYAVKYWMEKYNIPRRSRVESSFYAYWNRHNNGGHNAPNRLIRKLSIKEIKDLYYKKGHSAKEVGRFLGRGESGIYKFMRKHNLSRRSSAETNSIIYDKQDPSFHLKEYLTPEEEKLKIAGIMLYWAEGAKAQKVLGTNRKRHAIDLANSDPEMIKLFLKFLREICGVDENRLRVLIYCYANQNVNSLRNYWQKISGIPLKQFIRPYVRQDFLPEKIGKMEYGLVHIRYSDKKLFLQIGDWTKQYLNESI